MQGSGLHRQYYTNRQTLSQLPLSLEPTFHPVLRSRNLRTSTFHPFNLSEGKKFLLYALCTLPLISCYSGAWRLTEMLKEIYTLSSETS